MSTKCHKIEYFKQPTLDTINSTWLHFKDFFKSINVNKKQLTEWMKTAQQKNFTSKQFVKLKITEGGVSPLNQDNYDSIDIEDFYPEDAPYTSPDEYDAKSIFYQMRLIANGKKISPIVLLLNNGNYTLLDGGHRLIAIHLLRLSIRAIVLQIK